MKRFLIFISLCSFCFAAEVFTSKETVIFVGGVGTKAGTDKASGCTKAFYDANIAVSGDLSQIMGTNGAVLANDTGATYTSATGVISSATNVSAAKATGMLVRVTKEGATFPTGIYEVLADVGGAGTITIDSGLAGDGEAVTLDLGGAFDGLQNAFDDTSQILKSGWILTNKNETLSADLTIAAGGANSAVSRLYIWGFNTTPPSDLNEVNGDMDVGGEYYASALDVLQNSRTPATGTKVVITQGAAAAIFTVTDGKGIEFRNLDLIGYTGQDIFNFSGSAYNIAFRSCSFNSYDDCVAGSTQYVPIATDCYFGIPDDFIDNSTAAGGYYDSCIFDLKTGGYGMLDSGWVYNKCLFLNGLFGVRFNRTIVENCVFYNQTESGISIASATDGVGGVKNCIFLLANAIPVIKIEAAGGSVGLFANNCYYGTDGAALASPFDNNGTAFTPVGNGNIVADPQFVDVSAYNFTLKTTSPCLNTGLSSLGYSSIGAWQPKYEQKPNSLYNRIRNSIFGDL